MFECGWKTTGSLAGKFLSSAMRNSIGLVSFFSIEAERMKTAKPAKRQATPGIRITARELIELLLAIAVIIAACQGHAIPGLK
jgi:hypothetical protein